MGVRWKGGESGERSRRGETQESYRKCPFPSLPWGPKTSNATSAYAPHPTLVGLRPPVLGARSLCPLSRTTSPPAHSGGGGSRGRGGLGTQLPPEGQGRRYQLSPSLKWGWGE